MPIASTPWMATLRHWPAGSVCDHQEGLDTAWYIWRYAAIHVEGEVGGASFSDTYTCLASAPATRRLYLIGSAYEPRARSADLAIEVPRACARSKSELPLLDSVA